MSRTPVSSERLTQCEELDLITKAKAGDRRAMDRLIRVFKPLLDKTASTYSRQLGQPFDDVRQECAMGFVRSVELFDVKCGTRLATYAKKNFLSRVMDLSAEMNPHIALPKSTRTKILTCRLKLEMRKLGISGYEQIDVAIARELAKTLTTKWVRITPKIIFEFIEAKSIQKAVRPASDDWLDEEEYQVAFDPKAEEKLILAQNGRLARAALEDLTEIERDVITGRFMQDSDAPATHREIGNRWDMSKTNIGKIERRALAKLRTKLKDAA